MDLEVFYFIQIISTFSCLPALVPGLAMYNSLRAPLKGFVLFLCLGFVVDLLGWIFYLTNAGAANQSVRHVYILIECAFLFWFVSKALRPGLLATISQRMWIPIIPAWLAAINFVDGISYLMMIFQIIISFLLAYSLLQQVEKGESPFRRPLFWILTGSFIYYFCTFFLVSFLNSQFGVNLWYLRNIIGIIANLIYAWGIYQQKPGVAPIRPR